LRADLLAVLGVLVIALSGVNALSATVGGPSLGVTVQRSAEEQDPLESVNEQLGSEVLTPVVDIQTHVIDSGGSTAVAWFTGETVVARVSYGSNWVEVSYNLAVPSGVGYTPSRYSYSTSWGCTIEQITHADVDLQCKTYPAAPLSWPSDHGYHPANTVWGNQGAAREFWAIMLQEAGAQAGLLVVPKAQAYIIDVCGVGLEKCPWLAHHGETYAAILQQPATIEEYKQYLRGEYAKEGITEAQVTASCGGFWFPFTFVWGCATREVGYRTVIYTGNAKFSSAGSGDLGLKVIIQEETDPAGLEKAVSFVPAVPPSGAPGGCIAEGSCDWISIHPQMGERMSPSGNSWGNTDTLGYSLNQQDSFGNSLWSIMEYTYIFSGCQPGSTANQDPGTCPNLDHPDVKRAIAYMNSLPTLIDKVVFTEYFSHASGYDPATMPSPDVVGPNSKPYTIDIVISRFNTYLQTRDPAAIGYWACGLARWFVGGAVGARCDAHTQTHAVTEHIGGVTSCVIRLSDGSIVSGSGWCVIYGKERQAERAFERRQLERGKISLFSLTGFIVRVIVPAESSETLSLVSVEGVPQSIRGSIIAYDIADWLFIVLAFGVVLIVANALLWLRRRRGEDQG